MQKRHVAAALTALLLAGCGVAPRTAPARPPAGLRARTAPGAAPIVDAPGVAVGVAQKVAGKYKAFKIAGTGTVVALDEAKLDTAARLAAKVGPVTVTKSVTFGITRRDDAQWPYEFLTVNQTDKETFRNKAQRVSAAAGTTTFRLDDGTTALIAADGQGAVRMVTADFDLTFGPGNALSAAR